MLDQFKKRYFEAILDTSRESAIEVIDSCTDEGYPPEAVMFEILIPVLEELSEIIRVGPDATLSQLYVASQISSEMTDRLVPQFKNQPEVPGKIVIGCAFEDFHGLGKKIVGGCLRAKMMEVVDLGLSVPAVKYVEEAMDRQAQVIGISSMMLHTARGENGPTKVRALLREKGVEDRIRVVVGGAPYRFHPTLYREVGADAWADNGISAADVIVDMVKEVQGHEFN